MLSLTYWTTKRAIESRSSSTPQKSLSFAFPTAWESPVPTGSIMTRSVVSMMLSWLSTTWYGGGGVGAASVVTIRRGPNAPMWSQSDEEPGPPL